MSANGCVFPPLPAGPVVITSQDTYANATTPLSVVSGGGGGGGGGPNLVVSTLVAYNSVTTSTINVSSINGAPVGGGGGPNIVVSSITIADIPSGTNIIGNISCSSLVPGARVTMPANGGLGYASYPIFFNDTTHDNPNLGQLALSKNAWTYEAGPIQGLAVYANSTIGAGSFQPFCCGDLYVNNADNTGLGTGRLKYIDAVSSMQLTAEGGGVIISSLVVSSINGAAPGGTLPTFEYSTGLTDGYLSSFTNVRAGVGAAADPFT